jgi:glycine/D-amino acid oxidase-like deaminating enzyme
VIIIGGGVAGCATAYFLAADGVEVALLERFEINTQASGSNAGSLHAQIQPEPFAAQGEAWARRYLPAVPFYIESMALWRELGDTLGADLEVAQDGGIVVAETQSDMRLLAAKATFERSAGLPLELLDARTLRDRAPYISGRAVGGLFCPLEGKANPLKTAPALADAARRLGARILEGHEVLGIRADGRDYSVETAGGSLRAPRLVNAAGTDTGRVAAMLGGRLEVKGFPIQLGATEPLSPLIGHLVYSASAMLTLKQNRRGTVLIGGGWPATHDARRRPQPSRQSLLANLRSALDTVPGLAGAHIVRTWAAEVNGNDSWLPLLGELPGTPGAFINYVPWMGFSGAPAAGRIVASLVQGRQPPVNFDVAPFLPG